MIILWLNAKEETTCSSGLQNIRVFGPIINLIRSGSLLLLSNQEARKRHSWRGRTGGDVLVTLNWAIYWRELHWPLTIAGMSWLGFCLNYNDIDNKNHLPHAPLIVFTWIKQPTNASHSTAKEAMFCVKKSLRDSCSDILKKGYGYKTWFWIFFVNILQTVICKMV